MIQLNYIEIDSNCLIISLILGSFLCNSFNKTFFKNELNFTTS